MAHLDICGIRVYHEVTGTGDPVLLLHGGFCSIEDMRPQIAALSPDFTVLAPERPGHGRTPDRDGPITFASTVADTLAYLDAVGVRSAHIIGFSDGAIAGLLLARDHPDRVRSLVAISANLDPSGLIDDDGDDDKGNLQRYQELSPDGPDHADVVLDKLHHLWSAEPCIPADSLGVIRAPALVMAGDRDSIRLDHTVTIAKAIPRAQLCIIPGASHALLAQRPRLISVVAHEFIARQRCEVDARD